MNRLLIHNAQVALPDRILERGGLYIESGIIRESWEGTVRPAFLPATETLDAAGKLLMPGIIDLHTDAMDKEIVPRQGADFPVEVAFRELERSMSGCGITTVFHSLHLGYTEAERNSRSKYSRQEVFERVARMAKGATLIHNHIHLRFEITGPEAYETVWNLVEGGSISLLSLMDHTPGQGQYGKARFLANSKRDGRSEEEALEILRQKQAKPKVSEGLLRELVQLAIRQGVPVASHDDDTREKVMSMHQAGVTICEFPVTLEAAQAAAALGMWVAGGACNVLRGGSLSGNVSVTDAIRHNAINLLCSDYYPAALLHAVFKLTREAVLPLHQAINLVALYPAKAVQLDHLTGSLEPGKRADLLLVDQVEDLPLVTHTFVNGHLSAQASISLTQPQPYAYS